MVAHRKNLDNITKSGMKQLQVQMFYVIMHMIKELIGDSRMTREQSNLMNARTALPSHEKFIVFEHEGLKADLLDF